MQDASEKAYERCETITGKIIDILVAEKCTVQVSKEILRNASFLIERTATVQKPQERRLEK